MEKVKRQQTAHVIANQLYVSYIKFVSVRDSIAVFKTIFGKQAKQQKVYLRNLGYCPTMYIIFDAIIALLSFPRLISHKPSKSLTTT